MDEWSCNNPEEMVFAQIGKGAYTPRHMEFALRLSPEEFREKYSIADIVVTHAGMGNILLGIELKKPLVLMPRFAEKKETRNNHQVDTVKWLEGKRGIEVAHEIAELDRSIQQIRSTSLMEMISEKPSRELIETIRDYVNDD